ncbi:MAG: hypothetical protein V4619_15510 [Bacteroidota bacterium]
MNNLINAAIAERELLLLEKRTCEEVAEDTTMPELNRMAADLRIATIDCSVGMLDGLINLHLERIPMDDFIEQINTNLSDQCN